MKKILLSMMAATMIFATSCENELELGAAGEESVVSFTITTPDMSSRAYSDGTTATQLQYAVYDAAGNILPDLQGSKTMENLGAKIDLKLTTGNSYSVIFWAAAEGAPYTVNFANKTMTVDYNGAKSNDEKRDAFYKYHTFTVTGAQTETITLKRPFAQLNIGTNDYAASTSAGYTVKQSKVVIKNAYSTLNLATGVVANEVDATFDFANIPAGETFPVNGYEYLAMNYVLVPADQELTEVTFSYTDGTTAKDRTVGSVPVQRNYRTNIYGQLLTSDVDINVTIEPNYNEEDYMIYNVVVDGVSYNDFATAAAKAMELGKAVEFVQNVTIDADETITVPAGKTLNLNLNGYTLVGVSNQTGSNRNMFDVRGTMTVNGANTMSRAAANGNGIIAVKHVGENMGWNSSSNVFNVTAGGVLNIKNANAINYGGSDMGFVAHLNNWGEVTLNVENSTLESNYVAVRVFNSGNDMNNVTINNSTLKGGSYAFWVHNYTAEDFSGDTNKVNTQKGLLNFDIFNGTNEFIGKNDTPVRFGFTNAVYADENGLVNITNAAGEVVEGIGTDMDGDYVVTSAEGFSWIAENIDEVNDQTIELNNDIDLSALSRSAVSNWNPIGTEEKPFTGTFDGNGKTIKNLIIVEPTAKEGKAFIGFFGYAKNATIKNVTFENVNINISCLDIDHSQGHIGAVAGSLEGTSTIENVTVKGDITVYATQDANGASRVAVVAGGNTYGNVTIKNVHVIANEGSSLIANNNTGAIAGQLQGKTVYENCSSNINVTVNKFFAGGIVGLAGTNDKFINCHTTGNIAVVAGREGRANDHYRVGGIAGGWADGKKNVCTLENCSYTGTVSGKNSDGSVAEPLDYLGYVGRGYTLNGCQGSKVVIDGVSFIQKYNTADKAGIYVNENGEEYISEGLYYAESKKTYVVTSAEGLIALSSKTIKGGETVKLGADINLEGKEFNGLSAFNPENKNTFDGQNFKVSNWTNQNGAADMGFIKSWVGTIKNVTIDNAKLKTAGRSAILAGKVYSNIENCHVVNSVIEDSYWACGIIAGLYNNGNIEGCTVTNSSIKSNGGTGGIVGVINETAGTRTIKGCKVNNTTVNNTGAYGEGYSAALICGLINIENSTIVFEGCEYANNTKVGEFVGDLYYNSNGCEIVVK